MFFRGSVLSLRKHKLVTPKPDAAASDLCERESALFVELKYLIDGRDLVWIAADPVDDVVPTVHAAAIFVLRP